MLRWIGGFMIIAGSLGLGIWYREQFRQRLVLIRLLTEILEMLISEVRYGKTALPECCRSVGMQTKEPFGSALLGVFEKMQENSGEGFREIFCARMEQAMENTALEKEEKEEFLRFAKQGSFSDGDMQIRGMEQSRDMLLAIRGRLEKMTEEKGRLAVGLGAMSGLLLVIVLL